MNRIKIAVFSVTVAGWTLAVGYTLFVQRHMPDPLVWGVPVGAYTTLWPRPRKGGDDE